MPSNPFGWTKNQQLAAPAIQGATGLLNGVMQQAAPTTYDPRVGMAKPNPLQTMTNLQMTGIGANFGPVGAGIGFAADMGINALTLRNQQRQYNQAVSRADLMDGIANMQQQQQPDYTGYARYGAMAMPMSMPKFGMGGSVPVEMEADELVVIPKPDGTFERYMATSPNAPSHEQGGVKANLPPGALVFNGKYKPMVEQALASGDNQAVAKLAQQMLAESAQAKQQGQPYSSGGGGDLQQAQQLTAQQQAQPQNAQAMSQEAMNMMSCGGMAMRKKYAGGGMIPMTDDELLTGDYSNTAIKSQAGKDFGLANPSINQSNMPTVPEAEMNEPLMKNDGVAKAKELDLIELRRRASKRDYSGRDDKTTVDEVPQRIESERPKLDKFDPISKVKPTATPKVVSKPTSSKPATKAVDEKPADKEMASKEKEMVTTPLKKETSEVSKSFIQKAVEKTGSIDKKIAKGENLSDKDYEAIANTMLENNKSLKSGAGFANASELRKRIGDKMLLDFYKQAKKIYAK